MKPLTPEHFGQVIHSYHRPEWIYSIHDNYEKMIHTGTWGYLMHLSKLPHGTLYRLAFKFKPSDTTNVY